MESQRKLKTTQKDIKTFWDIETDAFIAVEWSENIYGALPDDTVMVEISKLSENEREIKIYKKGEIQ